MSEENREFWKRMLVPYYWIYGIRKDAALRPRPRLPFKDRLIQVTMGVPSRQIKAATLRWQANGWM